MAAAGNVKIDIKKSFLTKSSGGTSLRGNFFWKSRFFTLEAQFPTNSLPGPEHLSFVYTIKNSEHKEVSLGCCTPSDVQVITEEERKKSKDTGIRKKEHLFAVRSVVGKGPRTYFLEAINDDEMTSWACKLKEYLSRGELFAVFVEPNQGIQAGNVLLTFRDNCLILLCCVTNTVLGVWQFKKLLSFGLDGQTMWFNTEKLQRAKTLAAFRDLTLSDVEDYITLTVDTQYTGPTIVESLKRLLETNLKRQVVKSSGSQMAYSVRRRRYPTGSQGRASSKTSPSHLQIPKLLFERDSSSVPSSPTLARKRMTCYDTGKDKVTQYHVTDLLASSQRLDDKIARQALKPKCVPRKIASRPVQSMPRIMKRNVSQVYFSTTSKADTARFVSRQSVKEFSSDDEDTEEVDGRKQVRDEQRQVPVIPETNRDHVTTSSNSSDEYFPMNSTSPYVNLTALSLTPVTQNDPDNVPEGELSESSEGEEYVRMTAEVKEEQTNGEEGDSSSGSGDHDYMNVHFGMQQEKQYNQEEAGQGYVDFFQT